MHQRYDSSFSSKGVIPFFQYLPDGKLIVFGYDSTGQDEGRIEIRDAQTLKLLYEIPKVANSFAFSPDGTLLAAGLNDGRIEYWRLTVK